MRRREEFKKELNFDRILDFFKLAYYDVKDKDVKAHNIIKTIVITNIYRSEKKNIFKLLEILDTTEGEFIFIDIVVPTRQIIDFRNIELLLSKKDIMKGLAYTLWDFITEYESDLVKPQKSIEEKITELFESGIIMPIVDDYLLYHKDAEKYDKNEEVAAYFSSLATERTLKKLESETPEIATKTAESGDINSFYEKVGVSSSGKIKSMIVSAS